MTPDELALADPLRGAPAWSSTTTCRCPRLWSSELCELAQWAPNHKRTWPWRFALAEATAAHGSATSSPTRWRRTATHRRRWPRHAASTCARRRRWSSARRPATAPLRTAENRDAVAAGVQNILLAATAHGLASYWGSCPKGANDVVAELCGFEPGTHRGGHHLPGLGHRDRRRAAHARRCTSTSSTDRRRRL